MVFKPFHLDQSLQIVELNSRFYSGTGCGFCMSSMGQGGVGIVSDTTLCYDRVWLSEFNQIVVWDRVGLNNDLFLVKKWIKVALIPEPRAHIKNAQLQTPQHQH